MRHDMMLKCERKALFKINNEKVWKWVEVDVAALHSGEQPEIRCIHCHGRVRVHKQNVEHGPQDHVEHLSRQDSENCRGGHYFNGEHKISLQPVT
jgi:hypothetical protein